MSTEQPVTVMVLFDVDPADQQELVTLALQTQEIFKAQRGFLGGSLHRSADGKRVVQHLRWRTMEDNLACMGSPDWQGDTGQRFMAFIGSGKATMDPQVYEAVASI